MKTQNILWSQGVDNDGVFVIENNIIHSNAPEYADYLSSLHSVVKIKQWNFTSKTVNVSFDGDKAIISGYFDEEDDSGRKVSYTFVHLGNNPVSSINTLKSFSNTIHCTIPENDYSTIESAFQTISRRIAIKNRVLISTSIVVFVLFALTLLTKCK